MFLLLRGEGQEGPEAPRTQLACLPPLPGLCQYQAVWEIPAGHPEQLELVNTSQAASLSLSNRRTRNTGKLTGYSQEPALNLAVGDAHTVFLAPLGSSKENKNILID